MSGGDRERGVPHEGRPLDADAAPRGDLRGPRLEARQGLGDRLRLDAAEVHEEIRLARHDVDHVGPGLEDADGAHHARARPPAPGARRAARAPRPPPPRPVDPPSACRPRGPGGHAPPPGSGSGAAMAVTTPSGTFARSSDTDCSMWSSRYRATSPGARRAASSSAPRPPTESIAPASVLPAPVAQARGRGGVELAAHRAAPDRREAEVGRLLAGEVDDLERVREPMPARVETAGDLEARQHAGDAVEPAARLHRVEVRADHEGRGRVRSRRAGRSGSRPRRSSARAPPRPSGRRATGAPRDPRPRRPGACTGDPAA